MPVVVTLLPNEQILSAGILDRIVERLNKAVYLSVSGIKQRISELVNGAILNSDTCQSLLNGSLYHELGVIDAQSVISEVIKNISAGISIKIDDIRRFGTQLQGGMRIEMVKGDYSEVIDAAGAEFISEGGYNVEWLKWLTLGNDEILVQNFHYAPSLTKGSRTGAGLMLPTGNWSLSAQYSGTYGDNWITRAIETTLPEFENIITQEIQRKI